MNDVEQLLRSALVPVEPAQGFGERLEQRLAALEERLSDLTGAAAGELADWELRAMRDPRNWVRPVAAVAVVGLAGGALAVMRARQQRKRRQAGPVEAIERGVREVTTQVRNRMNR